jgi:hypothetical protein
LRHGRCRPRCVACWPACHVVWCSSIFCGADSPTARISRRVANSTAFVISFCARADVPFVVTKST